MILINRNKKIIIGAVVCIIYFAVAFIINSKSSKKSINESLKTTDAVMVAVSLAEKNFSTTTIQTNTPIKINDCHAKGPLPDPECSPGAIFTEATINLICVEGYTKKVRNVSLSLKKKIYKAYGIAYPQKTGTYELDHIIPLELGGSNDATNLFPESRDPNPGFREKDIVENFLHQEACAGHIPLNQAQKAIALDWTKIYQSLSPEEIQALKDKFKNWAD